MFNTAKGYPELPDSVMEVLLYYYEIASKQQGWTIYPLHIRKAILISLLTTQELIEDNTKWEEYNVLRAIRFLDSEELISIGEPFTQRVTGTRSGSLSSI